MPSWNFLLSASETFVTAHTLDRLELKAQLASTRGCVAIAASQKNSMLFTATKKKLVCMLYQPARRAFIDHTTHDLQEPPLSMICTGMDTLCATFRRSYDLINFVTGEKTNITDFTNSRSASSSSSSAHQPCAVLLTNTKAPQEELLLSVEFPSPRGLFFTVDGRMSRRQQECIQWSSNPVSLGYCHPYSIAALARSIEIHNIGTLQKVQTVPIMPVLSITLLPPSNADQHLACCNVSGSSIQILERVPISEQVHQCLADGRYEEALTLCELCGDSAGVGKEGLEAIHTKYAFELFARQDYSTAMRHFSKTQEEPWVVLGLFPNLLPKIRPAAMETSTFTYPIRIPTIEGKDLTTALNGLIMYLRRQRNKPQTQTDEEMDMATLIDTVLLKAYVLTKSSSLLGFLRDGQHRCHPLECEVFLKKNECWEELVEMYRSLSMHRKALEELERHGDSRNKSRHGHSHTQVTCQRYQEQTVEYLQWLASNNEMAVLEFSRSVLADRPALGLKIFTRQPVHDDGEGEQEAIEDKDGAGKEISPEMAKNIEDYLLARQELMKMKERAAAVSPFGATALGGGGGGGGLFVNNGGNRRGHTSGGRYGQKRLGQGYSDSSEGDAEDISDVPLADGHSLAITFLMFQVHQKQNQTTQLHDELVYLCLDTILTEIDRQPGDTASGSVRVRADEESGVLGAYRRCLLQVLRKSTHYRPDRMASKVHGSLLEERAAVLGRLGRDEEVLRIYATQMGDLALAEEYCNEKYTQNDQVYLLLLRLLLQPKAGVPAQEPSPAAMELLKRHCSRVDTCQVLSMINPETNLQLLAPFLESALRVKEQQRRSNQVVRNLLKMDSLQVHSALIEHQSNKLRATFMRVLVKINVDQSSRPMTCREFMDELHLGGYGEVDFEDELLEERVVMQSLNQLVEGHTFNCQKRDLGNSQVYEFWKTQARTPSSRTGGTNPRNSTRNGAVRGHSRWQ